VNSKAQPSLLVVLNDYLTARIFLETDIFAELIERSTQRIVTLLYGSAIDIDAVRAKYPKVTFYSASDYTEFDHLPLHQRLHGEFDRRLDEKIGFLPLALRFNIANGFNVERLTHGNRNGFLNRDNIGPLPQWDICYRWMLRWYFSALRFTHPGFRELCEKENVQGVLFSNTQHPQNIPFMLAARSMRLPIFAYIASWDHPVGKGPIYGDAKIYLVQNRVMREKMIHYHGINPERITVTGWALMDRYASPGPEEDQREYHELLKTYGLPERTPVLLLAGGSANNAPGEPEQFARLMRWRDEKGGGEKFSVIFRPHPNDHEWRTRYAALLNRDGCYVQGERFANIAESSLLLRSVDAVVCTAGTILVDSVVNDRPVVAIAYDREGAPAPGQSVAAKNYGSYHYRELMDKKPFYYAESFEQMVTGLERALENGNELAAARKEVTEILVGTIDGNAAQRVAQAVVSAVEECAATTERVR